MFWHCACLCLCRLRRALDPLELEYQAVVSHHVGAQVLCKSNPLVLITPESFISPGPRVKVFKMYYYYYFYWDSSFSYIPEGLSRISLVLVLGVICWEINFL